MPFKSKKQVRKFFAMEARGEMPKGTAKRWLKKYGAPKRERVEKTAGVLTVVAGVPLALAALGGFGGALHPALAPLAKKLVAAGVGIPAALGELGVAGGVASASAGHIAGRATRAAAKTVASHARAQSGRAKALLRALKR